MTMVGGAEQSGVPASGGASAAMGAAPSGGRAGGAAPSSGTAGQPGDGIAEAGSGESGASSGPTASAGAADGASSGAGGSAAGRGGAASGGAGASTAGVAGAAGNAGSSTGGSGSTVPSAIQVIFVVALENHDTTEIVGNTTDAPYLNGLLASYASASNFVDQFAISTPSEPHYIWMEAGTNEFDDRVFTGDSSPSATNSTADTNHLVTQIKNATSGISWLSYQEGLDASTGACPVSSSGHYVARHNPFVFFRDVSGDPPSKTNTYCAAHHKALDALALDLTNQAVATFNFITPDLCHDMHGQSGCPDKNLVHSGDDWLASNLPPIIAYVNAHAGVIFIVWDEGDKTTKMPFLAVGPGTKQGYVSSVSYMHGSLLKSAELILGLPVSARVAGDNDFADLFEAGKFP